MVKYIVIYITSIIFVDYKFKNGNVFHKNKYMLIIVLLNVFLLIFGFAFKKISSIWWVTSFVVTPWHLFIYIKLQSSSCFIHLCSSFLTLYSSKSLFTDTCCIKKVNFVTSNFDCSLFLSRGYFNNTNAVLPSTKAKLSSNLWV